MEFGLEKQKFGMLDLNINNSLFHKPAVSVEQNPLKGVSKLPVLSPNSDRVNLDREGIRFFFLT